MNVNTNFILYYCITFCTIKERGKSNRTYIIINYHTFVSMAVLIRTRDHFQKCSIQNYTRVNWLSVQQHRIWIPFVSNVTAVITMTARCHAKLTKLHDSRNKKKKKQWHLEIMVGEEMQVKEWFKEYTIILFEN